tara:strand:- start:98 stop:217 length:120 start_codon:yes stop_codon:yes gene_type:complete
MKYIITKYDDIAETLGTILIMGMVVGLAPMIIFLAWVSH